MFIYSFVFILSANLNERIWKHVFEFVRFVYSSNYTVWQRWSYEPQNEVQHSQFLEFLFFDFGFSSFGSIGSVSKPVSSQWKRISNIEPNQNQICKSVHFSVPWISIFRFRFFQFRVNSVRFRLWSHPYYTCNMLIRHFFW